MLWVLMGFVLASPIPRDKGIDEKSHIRHGTLLTPMHLSHRVSGHPAHVLSVRLAQREIGRAVAATRPPRIEFARLSG
jgi:hypothetical protein